MRELKELYLRMQETLAHGEDIVLVTVIASSGSTPRGMGAKMLVFQNGESFGTIGGGAVEHAARLSAKDVHQNRRSFTRGYTLAPNQVADLGMICGGNVTVYFQFFSGADNQAKAVVSHILSLYEQNRDSWLITSIREGGVWDMATYDVENGLLFSSRITLENLSPLLKSRAVLQQGEPTYYVEPLVRAGSVYIFGGGHVSQELVPVLSHIGFRTVVFEDRPEFADPALFPGVAEVVRGDFSDIGSAVTIGGSDYVAIMTRGHQADYEVLLHALRTPATYVGMIGSRTKVKKTLSRILEAGLSETDAARVHSPIGLAIEAETPAEIAISIAGEMILHRAQARCEFQ